MPSLWESCTHGLLWVSMLMLHTDWIRLLLFCFLDSEPPLHLPTGSLQMPDSVLVCSISRPFMLSIMPAYADVSMPAGEIVGRGFTFSGYKI